MTTEKIAALISLTIISLGAMYLLQAESTTVVGTAVGAIAGFITGSQVRSADKRATDTVPEVPKA